MTAVSVGPYGVDTLLPDLVGHDRKPSAFLVYLYLWRHSLGTGTDDVQVSLQDITLGTGLSKRAVQDALTLLTRRRLVGVRRAGLTAVPVYAVRLD